MNKGSGKFKIILFLIFLTGIFILPKISLAADHYVRQGASGSNNGSDWTNAWITLPASLVRGDTYYIADGNYGRYAFDDAVSGNSYIYIKKATIASHGTETGWDSLYGDGQVIFDWAGGSGPGDVLTIKTSYWEIDGQTGGYPNWTSGHGFKITTDNPKASLVTITYNVTSGPVASNIHIYRTEFAHTGKATNPEAAGSYGPLSIRAHGTGGSASAGGHHFAYNYIHDSPVMLFWGYETGSFIFEYNYLLNSAAMESGSSVQGSGLTTYGSKDQIYRYNIFNNLKGSCGICLYTWHGDFLVDNIQIYGNIMHRSSLGDATISTQNGYIATDGCTTNCGSERATNIKIYNNTFANLLGFRAFFVDVGTTGNIVKNNIFYQDQGVPTASGDFKGFSHSYNWFYGNKDYRNGVSLDAGWAASDLNAQIGAGDIFANLGAGDFYLAEATATGDSSIGVSYNLDLSGSLRGNDGVWERGAYEYVGAAPPVDTTPPASPTGVQVQ